MCACMYVYCYGWYVQEIKKIKIKKHKSPLSHPSLNVLFFSFFFFFDEKTTLLRGLSERYWTFWHEIYGIDGVTKSGSDGVNGLMDGIRFIRADARSEIAVKALVFRYMMASSFALIIMICKDRVNTPFDWIAAQLDGGAALIRGKARTHSVVHRNGELKAEIRFF